MLKFTLSDSLRGCESYKNVDFNKFDGKELIIVDIIIIIIIILKLARFYGSLKERT